MRRYSSLVAQREQILAIAARHGAQSGARNAADIPQYDMTAVFEALVNAVAHRDYSIHW